MYPVFTIITKDSMPKYFYFCVLSLCFLLPQTSTANPLVTDSVKTFSPPFLQEIDRGEMKVNIEYKSFSKPERFNFSYQLSFCPRPDSEGYFFIERTEGINHYGINFSLFDGKKSTYINEDDNTISERKYNWARYIMFFKDYYYLRLLLLPKSLRTVSTTQSLRDTAINGKSYGYFTSNLNPGVSYYYIDKSTNKLTRQEQYAFMGNDTQIYIFDLLYVRPLQSQAELFKMFDDTIKAYSTFCKFQSGENQVCKKRIDPNTFVGKTCPSLNLLSLDSTNLTISDLPKEYILLDFSYNGCLPCHRSKPMLKRIQKEYQKKGVSVICLNPHDSFAGIRYAISKDTITYPIYSINKSEISTMGITGTPTLMLLDKEKKIYSIHSGYVEGTYEILTKEIDAMLAKKE